MAQRDIKKRPAEKDANVAFSQRLNAQSPPFMLFYALDEARENNDFSRFHTFRSWLRVNGYEVDYVGSS